MPGIAPINPGQAKAQPSAPPPAAHASFVPDAESTPLTDTELSLAGVSRRSSSSRLAVFLVAASIVLLAIGGIAWYRWQQATRLSVAVRTEPTGEESLEISCETCAKGTTVTLEGKAVTLDTGKARLPLIRPLNVGQNTRTIEVRRPGRAIDRLEVAVPVDFRVRGDLGDLRLDPPQVALLVEALPNVEVRVENQKVNLDTSGKARVSIDVTNDLMGLSPRVVPLERRIHYVASRAGKTTEGDVLLQIAITPLDISAPGRGLITESNQFAVSGRTAPSAQLMANGHGLAVGSDGRFQQMMSLSSKGSTKLRLRASLAQHAPRLFEAVLESVPSLSARAKDWRAAAISGFDQALAKASGTSPASVVLEGEIVETAKEANSALILVDVPCAKRPCLVKGYCGFATSLIRGKRVAFYGTTRASPSGPSQDRVLHMDVYFLEELHSP